MKPKILMSCAALLTLMASMITAHGQNAKDAGVGVSTASTNVTNITQLPTIESIALLGLLILLLLVFATAPILLNMYWAFKYLSRGQGILEELVKKNQGNVPDRDLVEAVKGAFGVQPVGVQGVGRSTMALTIVVIVGIAVFYVLLYPIDVDRSTLVRDVLLTLAGAISSIIGFYFGGRGTGGDGSAATAAATSAAAANKPPVLSDLSADKPSDQPAGSTITWIAKASDPENDIIFYKFLLKGPSTGGQMIEQVGWSTNNTWTWIPSSNDVGDNQIEVWIRDGKHAGPDGFDDKKTVDYKIKSTA